MTVLLSRNSPSVLRSTGVGPRFHLLLSLYTMQLAELIQKHSIDYHLFIDDSELYSCLTVERESGLQAICNMESCCREIGRWRNAISDHKTEVLMVSDLCMFHVVNYCRCHIRLRTAAPPSIWIDDLPRLTTTQSTLRDQL